MFILRYQTGAAEVKSHEFCIKDDELCIKDDEMFIKMMNFGLK